MDEFLTGSRNVERDGFILLILRYAKVDGHLKRMRFFSLLMLDLDQYGMILVTFTCTHLQSNLTP